MILQQRTYEQGHNEQRAPHILSYSNIGLYHSLTQMAEQSYNINIILISMSAKQVK